MSARRVPRLAVLLVLAPLAASLVGCGLADPYAARPTPRGAARATHAPSVPRGEAARTVASYARASTNWDAASLARVRARLTRLSTGSLAHRNRTPPRLAEDHAEFAPARARGAVVGVLLRRHYALAVTRETVILPGARAAQTTYRLYRATLRRVRPGWRVASWQPLR